MRSAAVDWLRGFAGRMDRLGPSLEASPSRRLALVAMSIVGPLVVVFVVVTVWRLLFGLP